MKPMRIITSHNSENKEDKNDDDEEEDDTLSDKLLLDKSNFDNYHHYHHHHMALMQASNCHRLRYRPSIMDHHDGTKIRRYKPTSRARFQSSINLYFYITIMQLIVISSLLISIINCDQSNLRSINKTSHNSESSHNNNDRQQEFHHKAPLSSSKYTITGHGENLQSRLDKTQGRNHHHHHHQQNQHHRRSRRAHIAMDVMTGAEGPENQTLSSPSTQTARGQMSEAESIKVAALATKLDKWLQCSRMNLLLTKQQQTASAQTNHNNNHPPPPPQDHESTQVTSDQRSQSAESPAAKLLQQDESLHESITCPPHFDGHLCWPQAAPGQRVQLPCPKIDYLLSKEGGEGEQMSPKMSLKQQQQQQQQQSPLESTLSSITGGDLNQSQEIAIANLQSIKPTGSRAGISSIAAMNQPQEIRHDDTLTIADGSSQASQGSIGGDIKLKYASRRCESYSHNGTSGLVVGGHETVAAGASAQYLHAAMRIDSASPRNTTSSSLNAFGQWQAEADYSECWLSKRSTGGDGNDDTSINNLFDPMDEWVKLDDNNSADAKLFWRLTEQLERVEVSIDPYSERDLLEQWTFCIGEVMRQQSSPPGFCPIIFDGWRCWPTTRAGEIAYVSCPSNQPGFSAERKAYKICTPEADWYRHPMTNRYWSNYTTCVDTVDLAFRTKILNLYVIGNLISLIALTASLIIFVSFKSLNCTRVTIHKNLFLSFITNNLMWIIWYTYVVNDANLLQSNPIYCRVWHILLHYFLVSNYFWMFCEGLYLHTILVVAFVSEDKILKWFYLLGWLTPIPIIITYAYNRSYDEYHTNFCWMEESPYNIILMAPIGISLLLNLVFLINIVRVLVTKLRANNSPDTHQTRKAVRATLILIPLLGLHYMLMPFRPEAKSEWEMIYEIIAAVCTSFQGICVAMLFCFCNGEVINVIKKKLKDTCLFDRDSKRGMRSRSNTTISNVFNNNSSLTNNHNGSYYNGSNHHHNNNQQQQYNHAFSDNRKMSAVVTSPASLFSPDNGNLALSQLKQPLMMTNQKQQKGRVATNNEITGNLSGCSQRSSVMTTVTNVSPVLQQQQQHQPAINETKLLEFDGNAKIRRPFDGIAIRPEETVKLLAQATETNNNNDNDDDSNQQLSGQQLTGVGEAMS